jgi:phospholipid/cholesterol/gamma-HCH transport system ATP-binding protein
MDYKMREPKTIIEVSNLKNYLGGNCIHNGLNFNVYEKEIVAIIGGSGCGKTTLLRTLLMLLRPSAGSVKVFGNDITRLRPEQALFIQKRWGVLFQSGALFSSLTLLQNVLFPLQQFSRLNMTEQFKVALLKIKLAGLEIEAIHKYPAELSGGMQKRAALARAIALDPELLFLDEPTSGLDPNSAGSLDHLILQLRESLGLTFVIVTHDLDTLWTIPDRVIFLGEGKVLSAAPMQELIKNDHPLIRAYFSGARATAARNLYKET